MFDFVKDIAIKARKFEFYSILIKEFLIARTACRQFCHRAG